MHLYLLNVCVCSASVNAFQSGQTTWSALLLAFRKPSVASDTVIFTSVREECFSDSLLDSWMFFEITWQLLKRTAERTCTHTAEIKPKTFTPTPNIIRQTERDDRSVWSVSHLWNWWFRKRFSSQADCWACGACTNKKQIISSTLLTEGNLLFCSRGGGGVYLQGRDSFIVSVDTAHGDKYSWHSLKYLVFCHLFHSTWETKVLKRYRLWRNIIKNNLKLSKSSKIRI